MILGSHTALPLLRTRIGIPYPESFLTARDFSSALVLESVSSAVSVGAGITGDGTGTITGCSLTTAHMFSTVERSLIAATSITAALTTAIHFTVEALESPDFMGLPVLTVSLEHTLAHSADSIMVEMSIVFLLVGNPVSRVVSTEEAVGTGELSF